MSDKTLDILKSAILLERKGFAFYSAVASQTKHNAVKKFFEHMAEEEVEHINILSEQFKHFKEHNSFASTPSQSKKHEAEASEILNDDIKREITAASYEAAAISAAISMEKRAVDLYAQRAKEAKDPKEKEIYAWLSSWEDGHLDMLVAIEKEIQEKIWYDNSFWPM